MLSIHISLAYILLEMNRSVVKSWPFTPISTWLMILNQHTIQRLAREQY